MEVKVEHNVIKHKKIYILFDDEFALCFLSGDALV